MAMFSDTKLLLCLAHASLLCLLMASAGCETGEESARVAVPSTIAIRLPGEDEELQRPPVEFIHVKHTEAMQKEGCTACHPKKEDGSMSFKLGRLKDGTDREALQDLYHEKCMGCHKERQKGALTCSGCHRRDMAASSAKAKMSFDYSLHERHIQGVLKELKIAGRTDTCKECHHVYNEATSKLEYKKGQEGACSDCHGAKDEERKLSLKNASHEQCVTCHLKLESKLENPRVDCDGCHQEEQLATIKKLGEIPRLISEQKDSTEISAPGVKTKAVPFDHKLHEPVVAFCTTCHHRTAKPCKECHTLTGSEEGQFVTMETAYHLSSSEHSCVGCHKRETETKDCAGCHKMMADKGLSKESCLDCHRGKPAEATEQSATLETTPDGGVAPAPAVPVETEMAALPPNSDAFPEEVVIDGLAREYGPTKLPHQKIVARLDKLVRESKLATSFHDNVETLCAGCHHNAPIGERPRPCKSCHGDEAAATKDKPSLKNAYHRQCIECHEHMGIEKAMGCTDCHEKASKEVPK